MVSRTHTAMLVEFLCIKALGLEASVSWGAPCDEALHVLCEEHSQNEVAIQDFLFVPLIKGDISLEILQQSYNTCCPFKLLQQEYMVDFESFALLCTFLAVW